MLILIAALIVLWFTMRFYVTTMHVLALALLWMLRLASGLTLLTLRLVGWFALGVWWGVAAELRARRPAQIEDEIAAVVAQLARERR